MKSNQILTANAHFLISAEKNKQKSRDVDLDTLELLILIFQTMNKLHSAFLVMNLSQSNIFLSLVLNLITFAQSILI